MRRIHLLFCEVSPSCGYRPELVRRVVAFLVCSASIAVLAAQGPSAASSSASSLDQVSVTGDVGQQPRIHFATPLHLDTAASDVLVQGSGETSATGERLLVHFAVYDGRTGKRITSSFGDTPIPVTLDHAKAIPMIVDTLTGVPVGSRVVIGAPPSAGVITGKPPKGVKKSDTLLYVFDVQSLTRPRPRASGMPVDQVAGLPRVNLDDLGEPTITTPEDAPPGDLVVRPLIIGTGPAVQAGQTITVNYKGALWAGGRVFDSSWTRSEPVDFEIGVGAVIRGWDEGLVGEPVGSQVLLVIPPNEGYGDSGEPSAGITGTDTLVFVVDIVAAS